MTEYCEICGDEGEHEHEAVVIREGASTRTADELDLQVIDDLVSLGAELSPWGADVLAKVRAALDASDSPTAWLEDDGLRDDLDSLASQVECSMTDHVVIWEDGYVIYRNEIADAVRYHMPYPPSWTGERSDKPAFAVYDQREGFTPAYALVFEDNATDAVDAAAELAGADRIDADSETLVVRELH